MDEWVETAFAKFREQCLFPPTWPVSLLKILGIKEAAFVTVCFRPYSLQQKLWGPQS